MGKSNIFIKLGQLCVKSGTGGRSPWRIPSPLTPTAASKLHLWNLDARMYRLKQSDHGKLFGVYKEDVNESQHIQQIREALDAE